MKPPRQRPPSTADRILTPAEVVRILEEGFPQFEQELLRNYARLERHPFFIPEYHNGGWLAEPIRTLDGVWGRVARDNFPTLVGYIDARLPSCRLITFSELLPGAVIKPHRGVDFGRVVRILSRRKDWPFERHETYFSGRLYEVIRFHLCVYSPSQDFELLGLRCGERRLTWERGKCVFFDDTQTHEAWNRTDSARLVVSFDVLKSEIAARPPGSPSPD